jgi:hypothetical protein
MRKADNLTIILCRVMKSGNLNFLEPSGPLQACNGTALPLHTFDANGKILTIIGHARTATTPFEILNCLTTDQMLYNIVQHTNQYILITQSNFSRESDAKLTGKIEI